MAQNWPTPQPPHEGGLERSERNPFAAPGPIWANPIAPASKARKPGGSGLAHTLSVLGLLALAAGIGLPWAVPTQDSDLITLVRQGMFLDFFRSGLFIFHVPYLNIAALSLAGALLIFFLALITLNRAMNIPVLSGCAGLLGVLALLAVALGLVFLFARQQFVTGALAQVPVTLGLYCWFAGLALLILGLLAEYVSHLRRMAPGGPSGLGRVL